MILEEVVHEHSKSSEQDFKKPYLIAGYHLQEFNVVRAVYRNPKEVRPNRIFRVSVAKLEISGFFATVHQE